MKALPIRCRVMFSVGAVGEEFEVLDAIVVSDSIAMMNDLTGTQRSSQSTFHDDAMFQPLNSVDADTPVSIRHRPAAFPPPIALSDETSLVGEISTSHRAEVMVSTLQNLSSALFAWHGELYSTDLTFVPGGC